MMSAQVAQRLSRPPNAHLGPVYVKRKNQLTFPQYELEAEPEYEQSFIEWLFERLEPYLKEGMSAFYCNGPIYCNGTIKRSPTVMVDGDSGESIITVLFAWALDDGIECEAEVSVKHVYPHGLFSY